MAHNQDRDQAVETDPEKNKMELLEVKKCIQRLR